MESPLPENAMEVPAQHHGEGQSALLPLPRLLVSSLGAWNMGMRPWVKTQIVPPVNRPIPTKIDSYPKMVPLALNHGHVSMRSAGLPRETEGTVLW